MLEELATSPSEHETCAAFTANSAIKLFYFYIK